MKKTRLAADRTVALGNIDSGGRQDFELNAAAMTTAGVLD